MYADHVFYWAVYGGELIDDVEWLRLSRQAESYVDRLTFGRLKSGASVDDNVRMAVCAVAERLKHQQHAGHMPGVQSESVGGQSVTYEDPEKQKARENAELLAAVDLYLPRWDPLRYAGVR